jgi:multimeric flavodoxin WrbA
MSRTKIVGVGSSLRGRCNEETMFRIIDNCRDRSCLNYEIEKLSFNKLISNSDGCLLASLFGATQKGCEIRAINLRSFFSNKSYEFRSKDEKKELYEIVKDADGFICATPVYFGDCSSYLKEFVRFLYEEDLIKNKIIGLNSVGAKRNGGQETAISYTLYDVLKKGGLICGNGPSTSQYGGTAWAGDLGAVREDFFGIETSIGTGQKIASVAKILKSTKNLKKDKLKISVWIVRDKESIVYGRIKEIINKIREVFHESVELDVLRICNLNLERCLGCSICPYYYDKSSQYGVFKDRIQDDDLSGIYSRLIETDGIIVAGYNSVNSTGVKDLFSIFIERTRQIRRDDFLLTNLPVLAYSIEEVGNGSLFSMKVMTSFLRHNSIILPPIEQYIIHNEIMNNIDQRIYDFITLAKSIKQGRKYIKEQRIYKPIGYSISE